MPRGARRFQDISYSWAGCRGATSVRGRALGTNTPIPVCIICGSLICFTITNLSRRTSLHTIITYWVIFQIKPRVPFAYVANLLPLFSTQTKKKKKKMNLFFYQLLSLVVVVLFLAPHTAHSSPALPNNQRLGGLLLSRSSSETEKRPCYSRFRDQKQWSLGTCQEPNDPYQCEDGITANTGDCGRRADNGRPITCCIHLACNSRLSGTCQNNFKNCNGEWTVS